MPKPTFKLSDVSINDDDDFPNTGRTSEPSAPQLVPTISDDHEAQDNSVENVGSFVTPAPRTGPGRRSRYSMNYQSYEATRIQPAEQTRRMLDYMFPGYQKRDPRNWYEKATQTHLNRNEVDALIGTDLIELEPMESEETKAAAEKVMSVYDADEEETSSPSHQQRLFKTAARSSFIARGWEGPPINVVGKSSEEGFVLEIQDLQHESQLFVLPKDLLDRKTVKLDVVPDEKGVPKIVVYVGDKDDPDLTSIQSSGRTVVLYDNKDRFDSPSSSSRGDEPEDEPTPAPQPLSRPMFASAQEIIPSEPSSSDNTIATTWPQTARDSVGAVSDTAVRIEYDLDDELSIDDSDVEPTPAKPPWGIVNSRLLTPLSPEGTKDDVDIDEIPTSSLSIPISTMDVPSTDERKLSRDVSDWLGVNIFPKAMTPLRKTESPVPQQKSDTPLSEPDSPEYPTSPSHSLESPESPPTLQTPEPQRKSETPVPVPVPIPVILPPPVPDRNLSKEVSEWIDDSLLNKAKQEADERRMSKDVDKWVQNEILANAQKASTKEPKPTPIPPLVKESSHSDSPGDRLFGPLENYPNNLDETTDSEPSPVIVAPSGTLSQGSEDAPMKALLDHPPSHASPASSKVSSPDARESKSPPTKIIVIPLPPVQHKPSPVKSGSHSSSPEDRVFSPLEDHPSTPRVTPSKTPSPGVTPSKTLSPDVEPNAHLQRPLSDRESSPIIQSGESIKGYSDAPASFTSREPPQLKLDGENPNPAEVDKWVDDNILKEAKAVAQADKKHAKDSNIEKDVEDWMQAEVLIPAQADNWVERKILKPAEQQTLGDKRSMAEPRQSPASADVEEWLARDVIQPAKAASWVDKQVIHPAEVSAAVESQILDPAEVSVAVESQILDPASGAQVVSLGAPVRADSLAWVDSSRNLSPFNPHPDHPGGKVDVLPTHSPQQPIGSAPTIRPSPSSPSPLAKGQSDAMRPSPIDEQSPSPYQPKQVLSPVGPQPSPGTPASDYDHHGRFPPDTSPPTLVKTVPLVTPPVKAGIKDLPPQAPLDKPIPKLSHVEDGSSPTDEIEKRPSILKNPLEIPKPSPKSDKPETRTSLLEKRAIQQDNYLTRDDDDDYKTDRRRASSETGHRRSDSFYEKGHKDRRQSGHRRSDSSYDNAHKDRSPTSFFSKLCSPLSKMKNKQKSSRKRSGSRSFDESNDDSYPSIPTKESHEKIKNKIFARPTSPKPVSVPPEPSKPEPIFEELESEVIGPDSTAEDLVEDLEMADQPEAPLQVEPPPAHEAPREMMAPGIPQGASRKPLEFPQPTSRQPSLHADLPTRPTTGELPYAEDLETSTLPKFVDYEKTTKRPDKPEKSTEKPRIPNPPQKGFPAFPDYKELTSPSEKKNVEGSCRSTTMVLEKKEPEEKSHSWFDNQESPAPSTPQYSTASLSRPEIHNTTDSGDKPHVIEADRNVSTDKVTGKIEEVVEDSLKEGSIPSRPLPPGNGVPIFSDYYDLPKGQGGFPIFQDTPMHVSPVLHPGTSSTSPGSPNLGFARANQPQVPNIIRHSYSQPNKPLSEIMAPRPPVPVPQYTQPLPQEGANLYSTEMGPVVGSKAGSEMARSAAVSRPYNANLQKELPTFQPSRSGPGQYPSKPAPYSYHPGSDPSKQLGPSMPTSWPSTQQQAQVRMQDRSQAQPSSNSPEQRMLPSQTPYTPTPVSQQPVGPNFNVYTPQRPWQPQANVLGSMPGSAPTMRYGQPSAPTMRYGQPSAPQTIPSSAPRSPPIPSSAPRSLPQAPTFTRHSYSQPDRPLSELMQPRAPTQQGGSPVPNFAGGRPGEPRKETSPLAPGNGIPKFSDYGTPPISGDHQPGKSKIVTAAEKRAQIEREMQPISQQMEDLKKKMYILTQKGPPLRSGPHSAHVRLPTSLEMYNELERRTMDATKKEREEYYAEQRKKIYEESARRKIRNAIERSKGA